MTAEHTRLNLSAAAASVTVALVLVIVKAWAVAQTQALSVATALADSGMDLVVSVSGLVAIAYAARPPDKDHHFGHGSAEDLAALGQALVLTAIAGIIAVLAVGRLFGGDTARIAAEGAGMTAMAVSIGLTLCLVIWQRHVAARTGNRVVAADSLHYISDLVPNLGAILALWLSARFGITGADSVIALIAALFLVRGAYGIGSGAWHALMDRRVEPEVIGRIETIIAGFPGTHGYHDLRSRSSGGRIFVDFHLEIDGQVSLSEAHEVAACLKRQILEKYPGFDILIHKDPVATASGGGPARSGAPGDADADADADDGGGQADTGEFPVR